MRERGSVREWAGERMRVLAVDYAGVGSVQHASHSTQHTARGSRATRRGINFNTNTK